MSKNNFVPPVIKRMESPAVYPDLVESKWGQIPPYTYRTNSQTDPVSEAWGFFVKYSLWAVLAAIIAIGLAMRNHWSAGLLLLSWGVIASVGYVVIFLLLSMFTPEGVAVVHEFFDYMRYRVEIAAQVDLEKYRIDKRVGLLTAKPDDFPVLQKPKGETVLGAFAWQPDEQFIDSIEDELEGAVNPPRQDTNAVAILADFLVDLYDHADTLLRDGETVNLQAGVTLPWSKRSDVPAQTKAAINAILKGIEPPLFVEHSGGRVVKLNTNQYPTKQDAISVLSV